MHWCQNFILSPESRGDISHTLVTLVTAKYGPNPGKTKFEEVARKLILKYPFMKDDMSSRYVSTRTILYACNYVNLFRSLQSSWTTRMLVALCSRIKYSRKKMREDPSKVPPPKKMREATIKNDLLRRYPTRINDGTSSEDAASIAEHLKGVTSEMAKEKPRDSVVLPLMRTLFSSRRAYIEHDAEDVSSILEIYPALRCPSVVSDFISCVQFVWFWDGDSLVYTANHTQFHMWNCISITCKSHAPRNI